MQPPLVPAIKPEHEPLERRFRLIRIQPELLIDVLNWHLDMRSIMLPVTAEIPQETIVVSVNASWESHAIEAIIYHPSFPVVKDGDRPPLIDGYYKRQVFLPKDLEVK